MATDSAPASRHYWQLPLFMLGLVAAGAACWRFPVAAEPPEQRFAHDLRRLKQALEHKPFDAAAADALAGPVSEGAAQHPEQAAAAHFLCGTAYTQLAEASPADLNRWKQAHAEFAQVDPAQLADEADQQKCRFRAAKAQAALGIGDAKAVMLALAVPPRQAEDGEGERRRLLAESYLRQTPPDTARARSELSTYLAGASRLPAADQARAKLRLAGLHLTLNELDKARTWLKDIGTAAPAEVQASAKVMLGRIAAEGGRFDEAATQYQDALAGNSLPADQRPGVSYQAGVAWTKAGKPQQARPHLERAAQDAGAVGQAAAVRLAEATLRDEAAPGGRAAALEFLRSALRGTPAGTPFKNALVTKPEVSAAFEKLIEVALTESDYALATSAATAYEGVAEAGRAKEKLAEATLSWATQLRMNPATSPEASDKFRAAAECYAALAAADPNPTGQADLLRRAAKCYRLAGDDAAAAAAIDRLTKTPGLSDDILTAAYVEKGESLLANRQFAEGIDALRQAMNKGTPASAAARVKLAVAYLDQARQKAGQLAQAGGTPDPAAQAEIQQTTKLGRDLLTQAAQLLPDTATEKDAHQLALFELGKLQLLAGQNAEAEARFRQLLQQYPAGPVSLQAKLYHGSSLLLLARDQPMGRPPADADRILNEALKLFESLSESDNVFLRTQGDIRLANTTLLLRKFDDMPALCDKLAKRYEGRIEELIVLSMLYTAHRFADRPEPAAATLAKMDALYAKLSDDAFTNGAEEYTRAFWEKYFAEVKGK